jgi:peptide/nickel transport system substrate-binding protein
LPVDFAAANSLPAHLDATLLNSADMQLFVKAAIHETLFYPEYSGEVTPSLAELAEFEGADALRVNLRRGVKFHDGSELTSADVKYTFDRIFDPDVGSVFAGDLAAVDAVEVVDDYTIVFALKESSVPILLRLSEVPIIPEGSGDQQRRQPVGAGPFVFREWEEGVSLTVDRFPDYYQQGSPRVEALTMVPRADATAALAGLETAELDVMALMAWTDAQAVQQAVPDAQMLVSRGGFQEIAFNTQRPPFDDVRVRRAFALAVDRSALASALRGPDAPVLDTFYVPADHPLFPEGVAAVEFDPARGAALFREAGLDEGAELTCLVPDLPAYRPAAPILQDGLARAGIRLQAPITPTADWVEKVFTNRDYDATLWGDAALPDPSARINKYYLSGSPSNFTQYASDELDVLLREAETTADTGDRRALFGEIARHLNEEVPGFPFVEIVQNTAVQPWIGGFDTRPGLRWSWPAVTNSAAN